MLVARLLEPGSEPQILDLPCSAPGHGQLRIRVTHAAINPADINVLEGTYGDRLTLPGIPGNEGTGIITGIGPDVAGFAEGDRIIAPRLAEFWQQERLIPASEAVRVPAGVGGPDAARVSVNPATAWLLVHHLSRPEPGQWLIQNAANSAVGQLVIQLAREVGIHTANLVRRQAAIRELQQLGGDICTVSEPGFSSELKQALGGARCPLALNAVGGDVVREMTRCLSAGATLATYGAMSKQPFEVGAGQLIFKDLRFVGFWVTAWLRRQQANELDALYQPLLERIQSGALQLSPYQEYPLTDLSDALEHVRSGRGKVVLRLHDNP